MSLCPMRSVLRFFEGPPGWLWVLLPFLGFTLSFRLPVFDVLSLLRS